MAWDSEVRSAGGWIQLPGQAGIAVARAAVLVDENGDELGVGDNVLTVVEDNSAALLAELEKKADLTETQPVDGVMTADAAWTTLINAIRIDDDPTAYNSAALDVSEWSAAWILIDIDSTLAPTLLRVLAQYSHDGGTTWWDYEEGLWASLCWEDTDTASGINKAYLLPCGGIDDMRIRIIGTGTDAGNFFDVTVIARPFRGSFATGHA